ncbi:pyrroloquinoline quinone biosynthesis protein PqqF [Pseudomonas sp. LA21]|uniref:pyrroloquinoline quinone biosynthesis protein PqqF n=1 Tax=unclassified Pseudomonas TaxID=196821 RepID=UPI001FB80C45|nr:pyrroloquinoline quinone biosynthesis protein PqqF [Pseudomonas sp. LA21]MCJ1887083.1 pyrroloquinoline quinone biosynthesis protein PqqF [Pseudomonas sp. LA21]
MATPSARIRELCLPNGLRVVLVHAPESSRAAALVRVAAGSHDEPADFPGLAHFLEHLLFLDSAGHRAQQRLMPWVQGHGGRLNASTQARTTDFFFEVAAADLGDGLLRLVDMLARPLLDPSAQLSEREVLEAEYIARSADADTLIDAALAAAVALDHPLRRFVAGRRASLPVESATFQHALAAYHRAHYHPGNLELWLLGPQPLDELQGLAEHSCSDWPAQPSCPRSSAPPLLPWAQDALALRLPGVPRLVLAFALDGLDASAEQAVESLGERLRDESSGGLLAWLGERGLADDAALRVVYHAQGQALLAVTFELAQVSAAAVVEAAFLDWLGALGECASEVIQTSLGDFEQLPALEQLRLRIRGLPAAPAGDWLESLGRAPRVLMLVAPDVQGKAVETAGFPLRLDRPALPTCDLHPQPWTFTAPLPASTAEAGALHLRWRFAERPCRSHFLALRLALRPIGGQARSGGVTLKLEEEGPDWALSVSGPRDRLEAPLTDALKALQQPSPSVLEQGERLLRRERDRQTADLPIRQLLAALPSVLAGSAMAAPDWATARWDLLEQGAALPANVHIPGVRATIPLPLPVLPGGRHWQRWAAEGEAALALFCPLPDRDAACEARWRLLARALEPGFHQRLRGQLNLGYALYCGFRQVGGWRGLLFAVQSPHAGPDELLRHLQDFLDGAALDVMTEQQLHDLASHLAGPRDAWQDRLAGVTDDHHERLIDCTRHLTRADLKAAHAELLAANGGWWLLANRA